MVSAWAISTGINILSENLWCFVTSKDTLLSPATEVKLTSHKVAGRKALIYFLSKPVLNKMFLDILSIFRSLGMRGDYPWKCNYRGYYLLGNSVQGDTRDRFLQYAVV